MNWFNDGTGYTLTRFSNHSYTFVCLEDPELQRSGIDNYNQCLLVHTPLHHERNCLVIDRNLWKSSACAKGGLDFYWKTRP